MNVRLLVRLVCLLFFTAGFFPRLSAQQAPANSGAAPAQPHAGPETQTPRSPADIQLERARLMMVEKRYESAIQVYQDLLKGEPKNAMYMNMIGIAYLQLANYKQARRYFERSGKADKTYSSPVSNLGMVWYMQKDYRRAIREYLKAAQIDPNQAVIYMNLGFAYYNSKKFPEAMTAFHKALELDPHSFEQTGRVGNMVEDRTVSNHGMFYFLMAQEYGQQGDAARCAEYLRRSIDEGFKDVGKAWTDPAFAKVINDPTIQGILLLAAPEGAKSTAKAPGT